MSTKEMTIQVRYICPACKGTGYVKINNNSNISSYDKDSSLRLYDKVCCDVCDNGHIQEWVSLPELIAKVVGDEFVKHARSRKLR